MIRRILIGLGGAPYTSVCIRTAVELALRHGAEITGITNVDTKRLAYAGPAAIENSYEAAELRRHRFFLTRQRIEQAMEEFRTACRTAGVKHDLRLEERETPFDYVLSQARYHDLIVMGLRGIFEHRVIGEDYDHPTTLLARLITGGARPIVAVAPSDRQVHRVMIAYSGSVESAKTMKRFVQLRPWDDIAVRVVTFEHAPQRAERLLSDAARYCEAHGFEVETEYVPGAPKGHLLPHAKAWGADLVVLGNSARSLLLRQVFGETALHAMANADLPLFLGQ